MQPTMLQGTSLRRPSSRPDDEPFDPASTAPTLVPPFTEPAAGPTSAPTSPAGGELEADDDEIVILETDDAALVGEEPVPAPEAPSAPVAKKAAAQAPAKKAGARKAAKKAVAAKAPAKKASTKKAAGKKAAGKKAAGKKSAQKSGAKGGTGAWVEPDGSVCPTSHPVKAKLRSAIYHLPGMAAYARTVPDRCYRDEDAAVGDGLRKAAR